MANLFYDHLIGFEEIIAVIEEQNLSANDRRQLLDLIDKTIHHHILDEILTHLPYERHKEFLDRLTLAPSDRGLLIFIKQIAVVDIEKAIQKRATEVKKEFLADIRSSQKKPFGGDAG